MRKCNVDRKELVKLIRKAIKEIKVVGVWEHVVIFYDGIRTKTYIDGIQVKYVKK
jgi:hypothetical protein